MGNHQQVKRIEKGINKGVPVSSEVFVEPTSAVGANDLHIDPTVAGTKTPESSDEALKRANAEKLARLEKRIHSDEFSGPEKEFVDLATDRYLSELWSAKAREEEARRIAGDKWALRFWKNYIEKKITFAKNKDKMGANGPLNAEKAKLFKEYLELKLSKEIPPEKPEVDEDKGSAVDPLKNQDIIGETGRAKIVKVSTDERAPEFPDVPLTPEERMSLAGIEQAPIVPEPKPEEVSVFAPEQKQGILKRGLKYTIDQLNPIKAFKEIREKWVESGAQFNEGLFEEKQIEIFFQDIPEAERENYGYSQLLQRARFIDQARGELFEKKNEKREQFAGIFSALGIKRDVVDDEDVKRLETNSGDQHKILLEIGMKAFANDPQKLEKFQGQFHQNDVAFREENLEAYFRAYNGKYGDKIVYGLDRIGKTFKEIGFLRRMAITSIGTGGVVFGGAVLGFGALGVSTMMLGSRIGISALGGLSLGIGKKLKYEGKRRVQEDMAKAEDIKATLDIMGRNTDEGIQKMHESISTGKLREGRAEQIIWDTRKAALWGAIAAVLGRAAGEYLQAEGITFKSIIEKIGDYTGLSQAFKSIGQSIGNFLSGDQELVKSLGGGGVATQAVEHLQSSGGMSQDLSPEDYARIEKTMASYGPGRNMDEIVAREAVKMHADGVIPETELKVGGIPEDLQTAIPETEVKAGGSLQNWAETTHAAGVEAQMPEIAKPQFEDIASGKFGSGGSIEEKVTDAIKSKPGAFGLDQSDPDFAVKAAEMKKNIIEDFYKEKGFKSYAEFDRYCRKNVWEKDVFRIVHNPVTNDISLECKGHGFHDTFSTGDVSDVSRVAPAEDIALNKPQIPPENVKPRTSVAPEGSRPRTGVADHQPSRGGGKIAEMKEIEADYQKDLADRKYARAVRAEQDLSTLHARQTAHLENVGWEASLRQGVATRGFLKNIIHEAGIGNNVSLWDESAEKWYGEFANVEKLVSQDVLHNDNITDINKKREILKAIFSQLPKPRPGENTWQAFLRNISEDPNNLVKINRALGRR